MTKSNKNSSFFNSLVNLEKKHVNKLKSIVTNGKADFIAERDRLIKLQTGGKKVIKDIDIQNEFGKNSCFIGRQAKDLRSQIVNCDNKKLDLLIKAFENGYQAFGIQSGLKNVEKFMSSLTTKSNKSKSKKSASKKSKAKKDEASKRTPKEFLEWVLTQYKNEFNGDSQDFIEFVTSDEMVAVCDNFVIAPSNIAEAS